MSGCKRLVDHPRETPRTRNFDCERSRQRQHGQTCDEVRIPPCRTKDLWRHLEMVISARDASLKLEVLAEFVEAQSGRKAGARLPDHPEGTTVRDSINPRIAAYRGSKVLGAELMAAGIVPPGTGYHAHHIVPRGMRGAEAARQVLEQAGIKIDSAENGIWLPGRFSTVNVDGTLVHNGMHSRQYLGHITRILAGEYAAHGSEGVISAMTRLRLRIQEASGEVAGAEPKRTNRTR
jgi:hypothetical protein